MRWTTRRAVAALVVGAVLASACGGGDDDDGASANPSSPPGTSAADGSASGGTDAAPSAGGGSLVVAVNASPGTLDPAKAQSGDKSALYQIYDSLIVADPETLEPGPGLASAFEFEDPTTLRLDLREGVTFQDGTPFDADAVKFNIERGQTLQGSTIATDLASVDSVEVVDAKTVRLHLNTPDAALLGKLDDRAGLMVSPTAVEELGDQYGVSKAIGTGPFTLVEWRQGESFRFQANEAYWQPDQPGVDTLDMRIIEDANVGVSGLLAGEIDMVMALDADLLSRVEAAEGIEVYTGPSIEFEQIYLNMTRPPLDDVRVRQAINYAIDREAISDATTGGLGEVANIPVPSDHWAFSEESLPTYPYDPEKARELLAEAGHPDGIELTAVTWPDPARVRRAEIWQSQLEEIGIRVTLNPMTLSEGVSRYFDDNEFDMAAWGWGGRADPNQTLSLLYTTGYFFKGQDDPEVVELLREAAAAPTKEERLPIYEQIYHQVTIENAFNVPLHFNPSIIAMKDTVTGFQPNLIRSTIRLGSVQVG